MFIKSIGRILHVIYPLLIFVVALTTWSSSSLSELAYITPPTGDGLNFNWEQSYLARSACGQSTNLNQNASCSPVKNEGTLFNKLAN